MKRFFAALFVVMMVFAATFENSMSIEVFAKDNIENPELKEKLQKNCWSVESNPDSTELTLNYAIKKIKAFVEADSKAYIFVDNSIAEGLDIKLKGKYKYIASTKTQRSNLKWAICTGLVSPWTYGDNHGYYPEQINGNTILTRWDLVEIMSSVCDSFYTNRIPFFDTQSKYWIFEETYEQDAARNINAIQKGIITSQPVRKGQDEYEYALNLNTVATREDLSKALKNLKAVVKYNCIKISKRKTRKESYTFKDATKDLDKLYAYLDENGIRYQVEVLTKNRAIKVTILKDPSSYIWFYDASYYNNEYSIWESQVVFANGPGTAEQRQNRNFAANDVDFIKTLINVMKKRNK